MKVKSTELLEQLIKITNQNITAAEELSSLDVGQLTQRPGSDKWNALECIEHLNRYSAFYNREISNRIKASKTSKEEYFKSKFLGNYFANMMRPGQDSKKMSTFKSMNPLDSSLSKNVLDIFISDQNEMLTILKNASNVSLSKTKTSITISKLVKLKLGDTLRVVIYHNQRHIEQALNAAGIEK